MIIRRVKNAIVFEGAISARLADTINSLPARKKKLPGGVAIELDQDGMIAQRVYERHKGSNLISFDSSFMELIESKASAEFVEVDYIPRMPNMEHQQTAFDRFKRADFFGLFMEMGTGKTKAQLDITFYKYLSNQIDCLLVFAPNDVHSNWIHLEIPKHLPDGVEVELFEWKSGSSSAKKYDRAKALVKNPDKFRVASVNIEAMVSDACYDFCLDFVRSGRCHIAVDESITIKNRNAIRTKKIMKLRSLSVSRSILSGQPISLGVQDLFAPINFLSPSILDCPSFSAFEHEYLIKGGWEGRQIVGQKNLEKLQKLLDSHTLRVDDTVLNLPVPLIVNRYVDMTQQQIDIYEKLKKEFILDLGDGKILDMNEAATRAMKMQQVVWGYTRDGEGNVVYLENNRASYAAEQIRSTGYKTIVACAYRPEIVIMARELEKQGIPFVEAHGGTPDKFKTVQDYESSDRYKVIIGNQAIARGYTMVSTRLFMYYSILRGNLEIYDQFWRRAQRRGQLMNLNVMHLLSPGTLDVRNLNNILGKKDVARTVLDIRELVESKDENIEDHNDGYQYY